MRESGSVSDNGMSDKSSRSLSRTGAATADDCIVFKGKYSFCVPAEDYPFRVSAGDCRVSAEARPFFTARSKNGLLPVYFWIVNVSEIYL